MHAGYFGHQAIRQKERIKRKTLETRRLHHRKFASHLETNRMSQILA